MIAKVVPYSSIVGSSVMLLAGKNGPVVGQLSLLAIEAATAERHRAESEKIAQLVADAINSKAGASDAS